MAEDQASHWHCAAFGGKRRCVPRGLELSLPDTIWRNSIPYMEWPIEYTDEFGEWWDSLTEAEQVSIDAHVHKLEQRGPNLPFPYSSGINGSRYAQCGNCGAERRQAAAGVLRLRSAPDGDPTDRRGQDR